MVNNVKNKIKKYGVTILLIFCMFLFVGGATAGILALIGAFGPSDADVLELFSQIQERTGWSSVDDYTGRRAVLDTFTDQGGSLNVKVLDADGYKWEYERMYDVEHGRTGSTVAVSRDEDEISLIRCMDDDGMWVAFPELLEGKVFHMSAQSGEDIVQVSGTVFDSSVTAAGISASGKMTNDLEVIRALKSAIQEGLSGLSGEMEVTDAERNLLEDSETRGYRVNVDKDAINDLIKNVAEVLNAQENDTVKKAAEWLERLHIPTDTVVYLFAQKDTLTRAEFTLTTNRGIYRFTMKFAGEKGDSSAVFHLSGKNNEKPFSMIFKKKDKKKSGCRTEYRFRMMLDKKQICSLRVSEQIGSEDSSYELRGSLEWKNTGKKYDLKADGKIKDLKMGSCVSFIFDDVSLYDDDGVVMATEAQIGLDADEGSLEPPQGDRIEVTSDTTRQQLQAYDEEIKENARKKRKRIGMDVLLELAGK